MNRSRSNSSLFSAKQISVCLILITLMLTLNGCSSRLTEVSQLPNSVNLSGKWQFISEDAQTYEQFRNRATAATSMITAELIARGKSRTVAEEAHPNRMILDVLINLLSLPRKELFFKQTATELEIDYGVAGYHTFPIGMETDMLLAGAEFKAIAGWKNGEVIIHILVTDQFNIYHRFRMMDENNLVETMEIELSSNKKLSHQRWYRKTDS